MKIEYDRILYNKKASLAAKGLYALIKDQIEHRQSDFLSEEILRSYSKNGANSTSTIIKELIDLGYLKREAAQVSPKVRRMRYILVPHPNKR